MPLAIDQDTKSLARMALDALAERHQAKRSLDAIAQFCRDHCLDARVIGDAVEITLPHTHQRGGPVIMVPFRARNWCEARQILGY